MEKRSTNCAGRDAGAADDPFAARIRGLIDLQREIDARTADRTRECGPGTEGCFARRTIEILRTLILRKIAELSESEEPVSADGVSRLALALSRVERADRTRIAREQAAGASDIPPVPLNPAESHLSHSIPLIPLNPVYPAESPESH
ncbi:MAG: hypothetical protein OXP75_06120 [Rhodospirillales bacterium]|nr:hypothetical protein [Rhodospirillales bacterium]